VTDQLTPGARADVDTDLFDYRALLQDGEIALLAQLRSWLEEHLAPIVDDYWARAEFPHDLIAKLAGADGPDIMGLALDMSERPARRRLLSGFVGLEIARIDASFASFYGVHSGLAMGSIHQCGSAEQRERWLPAMRRLDKIGAFGLTEPHGGSDVAGGLETTARRDGDDWVIDGAKRWIGNGTFADLIVVWARDLADDQVKAFVVEKDMPGFAATKMENKLALRITQNADLTFDAVRVPEANRLQNANSFDDTNAVLRSTRGSVAWSAVGVLTGVYEVAVQYAKDRVQFGRPIGAFQLIQNHLATILANLSASLGMAVRGAQLQDDGVFRDEQGALVKSFCTTRLRESVALARELMGGNGILLEYGMARYFNDAEALYSYEGTREINTLIVGRAITGESAFT
jgi:glutaryl-CoA dehydrogenase